MRACMRVGRIVFTYTFLYILIGSVFSERASERVYEIYLDGVLDWAAFGAREWRVRLDVCIAREYAQRASERLGCIVCLYVVYTYGVFPLGFIWREWRVQLDWCVC